MRDSVGEFQANTTTLGYQPDVAVLLDGRIAVTWEDATSVNGHLFNPDGTPDGAAFPLNTTSGYPSTGW